MTAHFYLSVNLSFFLSQTFYIYLSIYLCVCVCVCARAILFLVTGMLQFKIYQNSKRNNDFSFCNKRESLHGAVANVLDNDIVVYEFRLQSSYYIHFWTNTLRKYIKSFIYFLQLCFR